MASGSWLDSSSYRIDGRNGPRRKTFKDRILEIGLVMSLGFSAVAALFVSRKWDDNPWHTVASQLMKLSLICHCDEVPTWTKCLGRSSGCYTWPLGQQWWLWELRHFSKRNGSICRRKKIDNLRSFFKFSAYVMILELEKFHGWKSSTKFNASIAELQHQLNQ